MTSVYRVLEESASHSNDISKRIPFVQDVYRIRNLFINKVIIDAKDKNFLLLKSKSLLISNLNALYLFHNRYDLFIQNYSQLRLIAVINKKYSILLRIGYTKLGWKILLFLYHLRANIPNFRKYI